MRILLVLAAAATVVGCASTPPARVPMLGAPHALQRLVGQWEGAYVANATSRSGSIFFRVQTDSTGVVANGDVAMVLLGQPAPGIPEYSIVDPRVQRVPQTQLLSIRFVQVDDTQIEGTLDPYRDPDCGCTLRTTFYGALKGDYIRGTYVTRHLDEGTTTAGTWSVRRHAR